MSGADHLNEEKGGSQDLAEKHHLRRLTTCTSLFDAL